MKFTLKKYDVITAFFFIGIGFTSYAQSLNVGFLFNSGITLGSDFISSTAVNDSVNFQLIRHKGQFVLPLKTELGVEGFKLKEFSLKKLDLKASQVFLTFNGSLIQPTLSENNNFENLYRGDLGLTGIYVSIKKGIWMYSANLYLVENTTTLKKSPSPNFRGYVAKVKIVNLKFIYFYGASLIIDQGRIIPVPLLGFRKSFSPNITASLLFPLQAKLNYKINRNLNFDIAANYDGLNTIGREGSTLNGNDDSYNYRQLKTYVGINGKLGANFKVLVELGYSSFQKIVAVSNDFSQDVTDTPYVSFALNYHFGKSVFGNFINKME